MDEILFSHIFKLIFENTNDLIILEKLKRVHINWTRTIDKILETTEVWKRACLNEIQSEIISCMITRLIPTVSFENYHELDDFILWRTVYISYRKWIILSKLRVSVDEFSYETDSRSNYPVEIVAFASCDKYFAIGTNQKMIYVFDFNQFNEPVYLKSFVDSIRSIKFWYPGTGHLFLVVLFWTFDIKFFNVSTDMNEVPCINVERPEAMVLCTGSMNTLFTMYYQFLNQYKYNTESGIKQYKTGTLDSVMCERLFSENKKLIHLATSGRKNLTLTNYQILTSDENNNMLPEKDRTINFKRGVNVPFEFIGSKFDFLTSNVILQISTQENSHLIIDNHQTNWDVYYPFRKFGRKNLVTSGILHGRVLILGFSTGHVRIFTVEHSEQLKNSQLDLHSGIEHHVVDDKPIQWLQVAETQEKLIVLAIKDDRIYSINFIPQNSIV